MCNSSPKVVYTQPKTQSTQTTTQTAAQSEPEKKEEEKIQTPTQADATLTKSVLGRRNKATGLAGRDTRTSARGLTSDRISSAKKEILGG